MLSGSRLFDGQRRLLGHTPPGRNARRLQAGMPALRLLQLVENLALGRKTSLVSFREDRLSVDRDDEDSSAAADDFAVDRKLSFDLSRQTGGSWEIVSNAAVVDSNVHEINGQWTIEN
jgi:hypothetical protein